MVRELVDDGIAVVWSTSYLDEAERCAEVLLLHEGGCCYAGPPQRLTERMAGRSFWSKRRRQQPRAARPRAAPARSGRRRHPGQSRAPGHGGGRAAALRGEARPGGRDHRQRRAAALRGCLCRDARRHVPSGIGDTGRGPGRTRDRDTVVEARALTKRFGNFTAADAISFAIRRGEIFGLLGPNGAGKSTTFKMMCGLMRPSSGAAAVEGHRPLQGGLRRAPPHRLHGAEILALWRSLACARISNSSPASMASRASAAGRRSRAWSNASRSSRFSRHGRRPAFGLQAATGARLRRHARARRAFPRRADFRRRSADPARVLARHQRHGRAAASP